MMNLIVSITCGASIASIGFFILEFFFDKEHLKKEFFTFLPIIFASIAMIDNIMVFGNREWTICAFSAVLFFVILVFFMLKIRQRSAERIQYKRIVQIMRNLVEKKKVDENKI